MRSTMAETGRCQSHALPAAEVWCAQPALPGGPGKLPTWRGLYSSGWALGGNRTARSSDRMK